MSKNDKTILIASIVIDIIGVVTCVLMHNYLAAFLWLFLGIGGDASLWRAKNVMAMQDELLEIKDARIEALERIIEAMK